MAARGGRAVVAAGQYARTEAVVGGEKRLAAEWPLIGPELPPTMPSTELTPGWSMNEVGSVATDRHDNVYVFNRSERRRGSYRVVASPPYAPVELIPLVLRHTEVPDSSIDRLVSRVLGVAPRCRPPTPARRRKHRRARE